MGERQITIIGAGISGMVAAINLVRAGYEVQIWDAAMSLGTLEAFHPSVHATPIMLEEVSEYIGIDISSCFTGIRKFRVYIDRDGFQLNPEFFHLVERGGRKSSLDTLLYNVAVEAGVKFEFGRMIRQLSDVPDNAIIATGINKEGMEAVGVPYVEGDTAYACKKLDDPRLSGTSVGWIGKYTGDYCYLTVANELVFASIVSRGAITEEQLSLCQRHMKETEGIEFSKWRIYHGHIPLLNDRCLRLFMGSRILAGTMSGMIDPAALYGVHGALLSGKIAALAVGEPERAQAEFDRVNRNFKAVLKRSRDSREMPWRVPFLRFCFKHPKLMRPLLGLSDNGIPGYERHWLVDALRPVSDAAE